jgi:hypothetical protein
MLLVRQEMKTAKPNVNDTRRDILRSLKLAIVEGASWRYEHLVALAQQAGVTDEEIDGVAHEALQALLDGAELPLTPRQLAHDWPTAHFRH